MIRRFRPKYSDEELAELYPAPHEHTQWPDHRLRVATTIALAKIWFEPKSVADLSCGDGAILASFAGQTDALYFGDIAGGYTYHGPIEETIEQIPRVDLYVCSETLEHLDDPPTVLKQIRAKAAHLVLSTPNDEQSDANPEHYWGWDVDDVRGLLKGAGFTPVILSTVGFDDTKYGYQIWLCD